MQVFRCPTRLLIRPGILHGALTSLLNELPTGRVLLVTDQGLRSSRWCHTAMDAIRTAAGAPRELSVFDSIEVNPRLSTARKIGEMAVSEGASAVVALGGGSAIDAGKAGAMLATNMSSESADDALLRFVGRNKFVHRPLHFVAIPTTCGTGSECTWVSVLSHPKTRRKVSIKGDGMYPYAAIVDAELLTTLPVHLIAQTAFDALTHAMEAFTGLPANPVSDALAIRSIQLILVHLPAAVAATSAPPSEPLEEGAILYPFKALAEASTMAGLAFSNSDVGGVHCLSESIGGAYDVPHGLANATLLVPYFSSCLRRAVEGEGEGGRGTRLEERLFEIASAALTAVKEANSGRNTNTEDESWYGHLRDHVDKSTELPATEWLLWSIRDIQQRVGGIPERFDTASFNQPFDMEWVAREAVLNNSNPSCPLEMTERDYEAVMSEVT
mmetsp:Transcript_109/g.365  ORF Transcript_109/g.365 Transcript_109/m.365 type:complete len:442 (-) Transcript_109:111-1436(-)